MMMFVVVVVVRAKASSGPLALSKRFEPYRGWGWRTESPPTHNSEFWSLCRLGGAIGIAQNLAYFAHRPF